MNITIVIVFGTQNLEENVTSEDFKVCIRLLMSDDVTYLKHGI